MKNRTILDDLDEVRMPREEAIDTVISAVNDRDIIVGTTGMSSRYE